MVDISYPLVIAAAKTAFKALDLKFHFEGLENIPPKGQGALIAMNHTSYVDYLVGGYPGEKVGRYTRFMAKKEIFDHPVGGPLMRSFHHIPVDRAAGLASMDDAAGYLRRGELVAIYPEATISRSFLIKDLKTGAVRIAAKANVPVIPMIVFGTHRVFTKDHPKDLSRHKTVIVKIGEPIPCVEEDPVGQTENLHKVLSTLLDQAIQEYPADEKPAGAWWIPASYGGSAPTLEEAERIDAEEKRERARRKAEKRAKKK
ncbi:MAG TPA: lysophospholipid acyltransferase family protein [Nocardioidaceae bacterium]|nr:lysophospholipid acyltransferase family protein [Nocardioidaceae bacterium]